MILQDKSRSSENRPFLSLSKKAFLFWGSFIMGLFALFFFVGTLVGRGQIKVDLGQNALFQEINGIAESTATNTETETIKEEVIPDNFDFYNDLPKENGKKAEIEVNTTPSTKKKTKQVVKKNLAIVKPDDLDDVDHASSVQPTESTVAAKQAHEPKEKPKTERVVPVTMTTSAEKPKADTVQKDKATSEDKTKKETADKSKADTQTKTKQETADKAKSDSTVKGKTATADNAKKTEKPKAAEKDDTSPKKFSLQVAALRSADDADDMVKKLSDLGFSAYMVKSGDNEPWYKVRVGTYKDRTEAEKTITKLKSKNFDAFVVNR